MNSSPPPPPPHLPPKTPSVPQGQDGKIKDTFGGRKEMNRQFTSSLHVSHAKGQKWQTLPWLDLCSQEIWRVALPRQREAHHLGCPLLSAWSWTSLPCPLSSLFTVIAYYYFCKCQNFHFFKSFEYLQNLSFQILLKLNRCRQGRDNNGKPYFPPRATVLSLALPHLRFLKGNVIILLINRKSDRPICQE